jgi:hypothetical protein
MSTKKTGSQEAPIFMSKRTKVAIVGFAANWDQAPFHDPEFEIWGLNELYRYFAQKKGARVDRWFEVHSRNSPTKNSKEHIGWLQQCPVPLYMKEHYNDMPNSVPFPIQETLDFIKSKGLVITVPQKDGSLINKDNRYVTNSISWMFLLAWMQGFKEIHIYGVDLAQKDEYKKQRPNLEYYIGAAQAEGIIVAMPESCDLLKAHCLYGFETDNPFTLKMKSRAGELAQRKKQVNQQIAQVEMQLSQMEQKREDFIRQTIALDASIAEINYWIQNWIVTDTSN